MQTDHALQNKKILIAGATGFLGRRLCKLFDKKKISYVPASLSTGVDFRNSAQTLALFETEKPNVIINCAAFVGGIKFGLERSGEMFLNNTLISANLIESSRLTQVELFINPLSNCTYPDVSKKFKESEWWDGPMHESVLSYGIARKSSWVHARSYHQQYGMHFTNLILPNMYGPGDHFDETKSHALGALIRKIFDAKVQNKPEVVLWGSGSPVREWLYVDDAAEIILRCVGMEPILGPVNIGPGTGISILELATMIKDVSGYEGGISLDTTKPDGAPYKVFDVTEMKRIFNWFPPTSLEAGLKHTIDWYVENIIHV